MIKFLANENFPLASLKILKLAGFDISYIGTDFKGISENEVIQIAIQENRTILTFDRDYGELIFKKKYKPTAGVIYFRWNEFLPDYPGKYLIELLNSLDISFEGKLTVITKDSVRQKNYL